MKQKSVKSKKSIRSKNNNLVHRKSLTKCLKMSEGGENLIAKNGINQHQENHQQLNLHHHRSITINDKHGKALVASNNNENLVSCNNKSLVGGRLQFYKDGKFILELARAREGEKTSWISVPRKTFWPPTITTNSSTTFSKHESSTSLSYSDDNSSIQSSPWQRDHCWKQSQPRQNISKEMMLYFHRPPMVRLTKDCADASKFKRRRPLDKTMTIQFEVMRTKTNDSSNTTNDTSSTSNDSDVDKVDGSAGNEENGKCNNDITENNSNDVVEKMKTNDNNESDKPHSTVRKKILATEKLDLILKKLSKRMEDKLVLTNNSSQIMQNNSSHVINYSMSNHISNIHHYHHHQQHVSPRKRILREFEKVSLEDQVMKRSRPKTISSNNSNSSNGSSSINNSNSSMITTIAATVSSPIPLAKLSNRISNVKTTVATTNNVSLKSTSNNNINNINNNNINDTDNCDNNTNSTIKAHNNKPPTRPFSYSITSLLGHNSNDNHNNSNNNVHNSSNELTSSTSHYHHHQQQPQHPHQHQQQQQQQTQITNNNKESDSMHSQRLSLNSPKSLQDFVPSSLSLLKAQTQALSNQLTGNNSNNSNNNNINSNNNNGHHANNSISKGKSTTPPYTLSGDNYNSSTTPSSGTSATMRSPDMSPSPEHHAFQKYRPQHVTPTPPTSSPYSYYHVSSSPNYMRRTPSPHDPAALSNNNRLRTNTYNRESPLSGLANQSPQSSSRNYASMNRNHSPSSNQQQQQQHLENESVNSNQSEQSNSTGNIRTVPKKASAFRQHFNASPSAPNDQMNAKSKVLLKDDKGMGKRPSEGMDYDPQSLIRPSALVVPPPPIPLHYYMYPGYLQNPYYDPTMAAVAAAYGRNPVYMQIPHLPSVSSPSSNATSLSNRNSIIQSHQISSQATYIPTSPWNTLPLTAHSISDGNMLDKVKDEPSSDVPLNLSKH